MTELMYSWAFDFTNAFDGKTLEEVLNNHATVEGLKEICIRWHETGDRQTPPPHVGQKVLFETMERREIEPRLKIEKHLFLVESIEKSFWERPMYCPQSRTRTSADSVWRHTDTVYLKYEGRQYS